MNTLYRRIMNAIRPGSVTASNDTGPVMLLQVQLSAMETRDSVVNPGYWGIKSRPHPGAQVLVAVPAGSSAGGVVVASGDQRYTFTLAEGEVVIYDDLGQSVHLTRTGMVVNGGGNTLLIENTPLIRCQTARFEVTGDIIDNCDSQPNTVAEMRSIYDGHTHTVENVQGGSVSRTTAVPNQLE